MKKIIFLGVIALLFSFSATDTFAQGRGYRNNERNDRRRIQRGVRSGRITRDERRDIRTRDRALRQQRRAYRSDGVITRAERRDIRRDERGQDRYVRQQRRDDDRRYDRNRRGNGYYRRGAGSPSHPRNQRYNRRNNRRY
ncbi:MAG: hypothetical protein MSG64_08945 [Pyrinomonadaceae bacterium MAG19_C2-C3]|nr:hypothetical protein [Pyrinomonadaceae bacterium MAG19_C2-C3]